jgi:hypothetical protein
LSVEGRVYAGNDTNRTAHVVTSSLW